MNTPTIQPGTRCGCRNASCPEARDPAYAHVIRGADGQCPNDAVRMVTVRDVEPMGTHTHQIPMCEPCATYHEAKAGAR